MTPVEEKLAKAKSRVVLRAPFFATILLGMDLQIVPDLNPPTMATNGKSIFVHPGFVEACSVEEVCGVLCHETMHVAMLHPWRRGTRQPKKANVAMDYSINQIIEEAGFSLPKGCLNDPQYHGMSFEAIYAKLPDPPPDDGSGQGSGGQGPEQFDDCMDAPGGEAQRQQDEAEAKIRVKQAANAAKAQGKLPSSLEKLVGDVLQPKIDWREELRRYMTTVLKTDQAWNRGQRKFLSQGLYLPALHSPGMGVVVVGIDTSGSVYEQAPEFLSEVQAICEDCSPEKIVVIQCDAKVTAVDEYAAGDPITAKIKGGGGTDLRRIYDKVLEAPSVMVLLTDGQTPWPDAGVDYPHITCTTADECPFGDNIKL